MDGFDALSASHWGQMVGKFLELINIRNNSDVLEVGCGSGAFLQHIDNAGSISGVDYSEAAIEQVRSRLRGDFWVAEASHLPFESSSFDLVLSFSVFEYFEGLDYALQVLNETKRVLRPGGLIFIGDINDPQKRDVYFELRSNENREKQKYTKGVSTNHLFCEKAFFLDYAKTNGFQVKIIDEETLDINFYSCGYYRYCVLLYN